MSDSGQMVWDSLEAHGYGPHGQPHDFRSRCSGHNGDNPTSLHVTVAPDGTVLFNCFAHACSPEEIVERIGLRVRDLFPVEMQHRTTRLPTARREDFTDNGREIVNVLLALQRLEQRWSIALWLDECPNCEWPWAQLTISSTGEPRVNCQRKCSLEAVRGGLAERLTNQRRVA